LDAVGTRIGINTARAELVTQGEIAVYDLRGLWLIARIARTTDYLADFTTEVEVARWLESAGFPAARLAGPADQPIVADGRVLTFWAQVAEHGYYGTAAELAALLRRLHALEPPSSLVLPELRPFQGAEDRIGSAELPEGDREFLLSRLDGLRDKYGRLDFVLPRGPIHGSASVNSVLPLMWDGSRVLVDLDRFAVGPREWDLVLTAMYFERFGWHSDDEYLEFASGYGFDVMSWPGYAVLRNIRELILLTWLALNPWNLPEIQAEVSGRIADLRGGHAD
jgi:Phosphotransferase enzyme family